MDSIIQGSFSPTLKKYNITRIKSKRFENKVVYRFDFILETFRLYSHSVSTLFSQCFDFILTVFRLYPRNSSTLFSIYYDFNIVILDSFFFLKWH